MEVSFAPNTRYLSALQRLEAVGGTVDKWAMDAATAMASGSMSSSTTLELGGSMPLTGVYSDPRAQTGASEYSGGRAEAAIEALESVQNNEFKAVVDEINKRIETQLGRKLGSDEGYMSLSSSERSQLSSDLNVAGREAFKLSVDLDLAINDRSNYVGMSLPSFLPDELVQVNQPATLEEAVQTAIGTNVDTSVALIMNAQERILSNPLMQVAFDVLGTDGFSDDIKNALSFDSADDSELLRMQLTSNAWGRYASGELAVNWNGQDVAYAESMYNLFVDAEGSEEPSVDTKI